MSVEKSELYINWAYAHSNSFKIVRGSLIGTWNKIVTYCKNTKKIELKMVAYNELNRKNTEFTQKLEECI